MATLVIGAVINSAITAGAAGVAAGSFGATALSLAGSVIGTLIDGQLFAGRDTVETRQNIGKRVNEIEISSSTEGAPIKRIYGSGKLNGNLIWTSNFKVKTTTMLDIQKQKRGKFSAAKTVTTENTSFTYSVNCAFAFGEQFIQDNVERGFLQQPRINKIFINGKEVKKSTITAQTKRWLVYDGLTNRNDAADPIISQIETNAPAYKNIIYIVFEGLELADYGNRIPQINVELDYPLLERNRQVESFNITPAGEIGYATSPEVLGDGNCNAAKGNNNTSSEETDFVESLSQIPVKYSSRGQQVSLNIPDDEGGALVTSDVVKQTNISLNVPWFGTSLRVEHCRIVPKVESKDCTISPNDWQVSGLSRGDTIVQQVTRGYGTPSDSSVIQAAKHILSLENSFTFMPDLIMDFGDYPDKRLLGEDGDGFNSIIGSQLDTLFGTNDVSRNNFSSIVNQNDNPYIGVRYNGTSGTTSYARYIYHYAHLLGKNLSANPNKELFTDFYVANALRGITQSASVLDSGGIGNYSTTIISTLMIEVRAILRSYGLNTNVSYAADWDEYQGYAQTVGSREHFTTAFKAMWANSDTLAINWNAPISDWGGKDDKLYFDTAKGNDEYGNPKGESIYDIDYLKGQVFRGEHFDYFYATPEDRQNQIRTRYTGANTDPIKHKDIAGFRTGTIAGKPIKIASFGCHAINRGTNAPNSLTPPFSNGNRDDYMQKRYAEAMMEAFTENTTLGVTLADMYIDSWDARPFPLYPNSKDLFYDHNDYAKSRKINGRFFATELGEVIKEICGWVGIPSDEIDVSRLIGNNIEVDGFVVDNNLSPREALAGLASVYLFDVCESEGRLVFKLRSDTTFQSIDLDELVLTQGQTSAYTITRSQETELPTEARVTYVNPDNAYQISSVGARKQTGDSYGVFEVRAPISLKPEQARTLAEVILQERWTVREQIQLVLPPNKISINPGDGISLTFNGRKRNFRVTGIQNQLFLGITAESFDVSIYDALVSSLHANPVNRIPVFGPARGFILDIPTLSSTEDSNSPQFPRIAAYQKPFPPSVVWLETDVDESLQVRGLNTDPIQIGELTQALPRGSVNIMDKVNEVYIQMADTSFDGILSATPNQVFGETYKNLIAVRTSDNQDETADWELVKFLDAEFLGDGRYRLYNLVRGINGSYQKMIDTIPVGMPVVLIENELPRLALAGDSPHSPKDYKFGASVLETESPFFTDVVRAASGVGAKSLPPVHARFDKRDNGVYIFWQGQTRYGSESIEQVNNQNIRYILSIRDINGNSVVTGFSTNDPNYTFISNLNYFEVDIRASGSVIDSEPLTEIYDRR